MSGAVLVYGRESMTGGICLPERSPLIQQYGPILYQQAYGGFQSKGPGRKNMQQIRGFFGSQGPN